MKELLAKLTGAHERHLTRHRPTGFQFAIADRIQFVNPAHWDSVTEGASFFLRRQYLRLLEETCPEDFCSRYALIYSGGEPMGALVTQILNVSGDRVLSNQKSGNLLRRAFGPAARKVSASVREKVLVCGNLFSWGCHGVAFASGTEPSELWAPAAEAIYRIRRAERLSGQTNLVFIKDISERETAGIASLKQFSYRPLITDPDMVLSLKPEWRTYQDYLNNLERKYRKSALQVVKEIESSGCTVERLPDLGAHTARLHELYLQVHQNAAVRPVTLSPAYLPALAQVAGADFRCVTIRRGELILGFVTMLREGHSAIGYYIGYDREAALKLPLYLRLLHALVEQAIDWGCRRLSLGRTALEPKARLGAKPEPLSIWVRHRQPAMNFLIRKLLHAIPHQEAPERNPFKSVSD